MEILAIDGQWSTSDGMDHADYASAAAWRDYCEAVAIVKALHAEHGIKPIQSVNGLIRFNHLNGELIKANNITTKYNLWRSNHV